MREALLILPKADNHGNSLAKLGKNTIRDLVLAFGGCTARDAEGYWVGPDKLHCEPVTEMTVAYEPGAENDGKLKAIAVKAGHYGRQLCMYVRYADGRVELVDTATVDEKEAA